MRLKSYLPKVLTCMNRFLAASTSLFAIRRALEIPMTLALHEQAEIVSSPYTPSYLVALPDNR
jgi:hypothetical protein